MIGGVGDAISAGGRRKTRLNAVTTHQDLTGRADGDGLRGATGADPAALTATAAAALQVEPPSRSENTTLPLGSSLMTKDRWPVALVGAVPRLPPVVTGKSGDTVDPAIYALPAPSTAMAFA